MFNELAGMQVYVDNNLCVKQVRFPKSKKKRIRKKYKKNKKNFVIDNEHVIQVGNKLYMSSKMWEVLKKEMQKSVETQLIGKPYEEMCKNDSRLTGFDTTIQHTTNTRKDNLTPPIFSDYFERSLCRNNRQRFSIA